MKIDKNEFDQICISHPKYKALVLLIEQAIHSGVLLSEQKLPAQRLLADRLSITHGTVTRAYDLLEKKGLVRARLGAGTYVSAPKSNNEVLIVKEYDFASSMQPMLGQQIIVKDALNSLAQDLNGIESIMTYSPQGVEKHKKVFASWLGTKKIEVALSDIVFTQGAQQGIYTCIQVLTNKNDYVLHEELAYPGFFRAVDASRVKPLAVPLTPDGLDLEALEEYCQKFHPKLLYITPNMQNPTNVKYSSKQLNKILNLSRKYQFYIIEDDVNYCLSEHRRLPLQQSAPDRVFYLSSLSKYVAGGLRVAFTLVPPSWQQAFNLSIHSQCWMVSTLSIELASRFITSDDFKHNQSLLEREMRYRQAVFEQMAGKYGVKVRCGGLNVWLELPSHMNVNQLNAALLSKKVKVRTADLFRYPTSSSVSINSLRVSLGGFNSRKEFDDGVNMFESVLINFNSQQDVII